MRDQHTHILNASTNLLSVCFFIITGLKLTKAGDHSWGDEIAWGAALLFLVSVLLSYLMIRAHDNEERIGLWADRAFLLGTFALFGSVAAVALAIY